MTATTASYSRAWRRAHPGKGAAYSRAYRKRKRDAQPPKPPRAPALTVAEKSRRYRSTHLAACRARTAAHHKRPESRQRARELRWLNEYGLTAEQVQALFDRQRGRCAICRCPIKLGKTTHIDHDHETDEVRGILCHKCNVGLGHFDDNAERLQEAARYLRRARLTVNRGTL